MLSCFLSLSFPPSFLPPLFSSFLSSKNRQKIGFQFQRNVPFSAVQIILILDNHVNHMKRNKMAIISKLKGTMETKRHKSIYIFAFFTRLQIKLYYKVSWFISRKFVFKCICVWDWDSFRYLLMKLTNDMIYACSTRG